MIEENVEVINEEGMHARPAGLFVKAASGFSSAIEIEFDGKKLNAKSIMSLMGAGIEKGTTLLIRADGADEAEAIKVLSALVRNGFKTINSTAGSLQTNSSPSGVAAL